MLKFPSGIKFKHNWRNYQQRVLDELVNHLNDDHLHIVAPPGSGKTILGLEVMLRINKPTLILAPTIAIKNQWVHRFCELFLEIDSPTDWISFDIKNPKFLTVSTYQGLHAAINAQDELMDLPEEEVLDADEPQDASKNIKNVIKQLKKHNIGSLVLDEAHHLKNAWWSSLTKIKEAIKPTVVGLTATPPYDVSYAEWQRYLELNGPVDAEISVPELIQENNLCPHQDFVYFSRPTSAESEKIDQYRSQIESLFFKIKEDSILKEALMNQPIMVNTEAHIDWIYTHIEYYSSTLIFLNAIGSEISKSHIELVGDDSFEIPQLNYAWMEILLEFYLYEDQEYFSNYKEHQEQLIGILKRAGAMERRSVNFRYSRRINSFITSSISKLKSINDIVDFEYKNLKSNLRMVVLTDYIRKEYLTSEKSSTIELNKIGVIPIFEGLRRMNPQKIKIAVLTGSIIILPRSCLEFFTEICKRYNIEKQSSTALPSDNSYLLLNSNKKLGQYIVSIVTEIFQKGEIEVLIGTKSLLGEGWDAPSINSLILASFVGSYVLSNQMRGRAIRVDENNPEKTSNVWHLVCVDLGNPNGGEDFDLLGRRFKSFVGISHKSDPLIENGLGRLDIPVDLYSEKDIAEANNKMLESAAQRKSLKEKWMEALSNGDALIEEVKIPFPKGKSYKSVKAFYYNRTIKFLLGMLAAGLLTFGYESIFRLIDSLRSINSPKDLIYVLIFIGITAVLTFGGFAYNTFRVYIKYRDISKDFEQIAKALLESLLDKGIIQTDSEQLELYSSVDSDGALYCSLIGGSTYEKSIFIKSLQEIISAIDNPRYIIRRKSLWLKLLSQSDYHAVPDILSRKKVDAEDFEMQWRRYVGACELIFTRTKQGRRVLLKSRIDSLASEWEEKAERVNRWA